VSLKSLEKRNFLLENLDTRWLMASADTFADYPNDNTIKSLSIACICWFNTVKTQESEQFLTNTQSC
jgi:hypothetical protein